MIQQRRDVESVNSRNMRLPLQIRVRSKAGLANIDGAVSKWTTPSREPRNVGRFDALPKSLFDAHVDRLSDGYPRTSSHAPTQSPRMTKS